METEDDKLRHAWKITVTTPSGRRRGRVLRWKMSKSEAARWSMANPSKTLELVPGSSVMPRPNDEMPSGGVMPTPSIGEDLAKLGSADGMNPQG
jgi:hypothetical protein